MYRVLASRANKFLANDSFNFQKLNKNANFLIKNFLNSNLQKPLIVCQTRYLKYEPIATKNKIQTGHKMTQVIEKYRQKYLQNKSENEKYSNSKHLRPNRHLLIACSNPAFNHYTGQAYKNFSERNLASLGWRNRRSAGQYFTINAIGNHPSLINNQKQRNESDEIIEFEDLNINHNLIRVLKSNFDINQPTLIQYLSLNDILKRDNHKLVVAETGGGKTLTYALPIIECAIRVKKYLNEIKLNRNNNQPICMVIVPTRELAFQVYNVFKKLLNVENTQLNTEEDKFYLDIFKSLNLVIDLHKSQIKAREEVTKQTLNKLDEKNKEPTDILITLPGQLEDRQNSKYFDSTYLRQLVLDEADTLLDDSFSQVTLKCLNMLNLNLDLPEIDIKHEVNEIYEEIEDKSKRSKEFNLEFETKLKDPSTQLLFVSATVPRDMKGILEDIIDCENELKLITTNKTNRLMLHVPQKFIRTNGTKRPYQLLEIVKNELAKKNTKRTLMIFSQKTNTANYVRKFLNENNIECEVLTKQLNNQQREQVVNRFFNGEIRVLSCTDIASRGWDTLHVNHVINFEMPQFIADYLHRVGRVGRLNGHKHGGNGGLVTNFIINRFEADLVWNIERSIRLGIELHNVNANIKRLYKYSYMSSNEKYHERLRDIKDDKDYNLNSLKVNYQTSDEFEQIVGEEDKLIKNTVKKQELKEEASSIENQVDETDNKTPTSTRRSRRRNRFN